MIGTSGGEESEDVTREMDQARGRVRSSLIEKVGTIAEFGFGMNPRSHISGNQIEDQVVRGSAYIAIGDNTALGGSTGVGFQLRGVMSKASVELEDVDLVVDGKVTARKR